MSVKSTFDRFAPHYDESRQRLIPCFDDFYGTAVDLLPFGEKETIRVLDLGAGTGLLSSLVARRFPRAELTLVDISENMLAVARTRLYGLENKTSFISGDYTRTEIPGGPFHAVVSALSIHHLENAQKVNLFHRVRGLLRPGGLFINADQVLGETAEIDRTYRSAWLSQAKEAGCSEDELAAAFERMKEDRLSPLSFQLRGMRDAGFDQVNCWYKHYSFVVYGGVRKS